jgi:hypothetical protein
VPVTDFDGEPERLPIEHADFRQRGIEQQIHVTAEQFELRVTAKGPGGHRQSDDVGCPLARVARQLPQRTVIEVIEGGFESCARGAE